MTKLLVTLIDKRNNPSPLSIIFDSDQKHAFKVGRDIGNPDADTLDFVVPDKHVSRTHCYIEYERVNDSERWFVRDMSTNGTLFNGIKLDYNHRQKLTGFEDVITCSPTGAGFTCDTTVTDPRNFEPADDFEPTINKTIEDAISQLESRQAKHSDEPWYSEAFRTVWKGPEGIPDWIWQTGIVSIVFVIALEWIRSQGN